MAKKQKKSPESEKPKQVKNPYKLNTDAVDRLVNADKKTYPKLTLENDPRKKYSNSVIDRIPSWVKALFIKFWFNGAVCFFIFWGLGLFIPNMENMIIVLALSMGAITDLLVNSIFRFFATVEGANDKWMMFPKKKYVNLFLNMIYAFAVLLGVIWFYNAINLSVNAIRGTEGVIYLGVEPIMFGLLYMMIDLACIGIKNFAARIISDAKSKNGVE